VSSDFDTFLKMMTAQVRNQDPLNPMDSTEFAVQLATFSGVEQQVKTNDLLSELSGAFGSSGLGRMAGWVGMEARAPVPALFDGATPVSLEAAPAPGAAAAALVVRDAAGDELDRFEIPAEPGPVAWSGRRPEGGAFPAGSYAFDVVSYDAEGAEIGSSTPEVYARVAEIRAGDDGPEVVFAGGSTALAGDVTGLRAP
jgi:flagellar basal-body rod modification protein FlgD